MNYLDKVYPLLGEAGEQEALKLIESFKERLKQAANEVIGDLYCDILPHIESDSWSNLRNQMMAGLSGYDNKGVRPDYDFVQIRRGILEQHRDELVADLNQDLVKEVAELKEQINQMWNASRDCCL